MSAFSRNMFNFHRILATYLIIFSFFNKSYGWIPLIVSAHSQVKDDVTKFQTDSFHEAENVPQESEKDVKEELQKIINKFKERPNQEPTAPLNLLKSNTKSSFVNMNNEDGCSPSHCINHNNKQNSCENHRMTEAVTARPTNPYMFAMNAIMDSERTMGFDVDGELQLNGSTQSMLSETEAIKDKKPDMVDVDTQTELLDNVKEEEDSALPEKIPEVPEVTSPTPEVPPPSLEVTDKTPAPEEIPTYSVWTAEKHQKGGNNGKPAPPVNGYSKPKKSGSRNYASPDCGSKVTLANPEAKSAEAVISPSKDEYMLSACTNKMWFIVRLCEPLYVDKVEIANYEIFASSPKEFSVYVGSASVHEGDWFLLGHFTAEDNKDNRGIQSFPIETPSLGKYIMFELHSHHGTEHYCTISQFRALGMSESEYAQYYVLHDEEEHDPSTEGTSTEMETMSEVLDDNSQKKHGDATIAVSTSTECVTLSQNIPLFNCHDCLVDESAVNHILKCELDYLINMVNHKQLVQQLSNICGNNDTYSKIPIERHFLSVVFGAHRIHALCHILQLDQKKHVNVSGFVLSKFDDLDLNINLEDDNKPELLVPEDVENVSLINATRISADCEGNVLTTTASMEASFPSTNSDAATIQPTPVVTDMSGKPSLLTESTSMSDTTVASSVDTSQTDTATSTLTTTPVLFAPSVSESHVEPNISQQSTATIEPSKVQGTNNSTNLPIISESTKTPNTTKVPPVVQNGTSESTQPTHNVKQESLFVTFSNKIRTLERNMSLTSQYLEELSRLYKQQMAEMQRSINRTQQQVEEIRREYGQNNTSLQLDIMELRLQVADLNDTISLLILDYQSLLSYITERQLLVMAIQIVILVILSWYCNRRIYKVLDQLQNNQLQQQNSTTTEGRFHKHGERARYSRRRSVEGVSGHRLPTPRKRRPSEEALNISGVYENLLIVEKNLPIPFLDDLENCTQKNGKKKRKRRKKKKSSSTSNLLDIEDFESAFSVDDINRSVNRSQEFQLKKTGHGKIETIGSGAKFGSLSKGDFHPPTSDTSSTSSQDSGGHSARYRKSGASDKNKRVSYAGLQGPKPQNTSNSRRARSAERHSYV